MRKQAAGAETPYSAGLAAGGKPIRGWLREVMMGVCNLADVPEGIREMVASMMQLPVYRLACSVLDAGTIHSRRAALERIPAEVRPLVEEEARKLFAARRK